MQAKLWCTTSRARKVVISLTLVAVTAEVINFLCRHLAKVYVIDNITAVVFKAIVPVAVLLINMVVVHQVRRSATNAAANLGVQQHHQSTSSNSVVPTVMLIATSLIYVLLYSTAHIFIVWWNDLRAYFSSDIWVVLSTVVLGLGSFVFVYNFYVYLITGKRFRSELHKLLCCCLSSSSFSSSSSPAAATAVSVADDADVTRRGVPVTDTTV